MRLASYLVAGRPHYGAVADGGIVNLDRRFAELPTLRALIEADALGRARTAVHGALPDHGLDEVTLLPPVPAPEKIWCIGVNYAHRNAEYRDSSSAPQYPSLFCRAPTSVV